MLDEVKVLLAQRQQQQQNMNRDETTIGLQFSKTLDYVNRFGQFSESVLESLRGCVAGSVVGSASAGALPVAAPSRAAWVLSPNPVHCSHAPVHTPAAA